MHLSVPVENINERTINQKSFTHPDGSIEYDYYNLPVHYFNGSNYEEFDNSLSLASGYLINNSSNYNIRIPFSYYDNIDVGINYLDLSGLTISFSNDLSKSKNSFIK
jgi:hypothetical protein